MDVIKLGLVDDHQIVLDGLRALLEGNPSFNVIFSSTSPHEVKKIIASSPDLIDVLITDLMMPEVSGLELARYVREISPSLKILALTMSTGGSIADELIQTAEINGYALKNIGKTALEEAITQIACGGQYFSEEILIELEKVAMAPRQEVLPHLTAREIEIIRCIEKDMNNKEIADALFISERTVETHRKNIMRKTGTNSAVGLLKFAYQYKLV